MECRLNAPFTLPAGWRRVTGARWLHNGGGCFGLQRVLRVAFSRLVVRLRSWNRGTHTYAGLPCRAGGYLFGETPPPPGQKRKLESWEAPW